MRVTFHFRKMNFHSHMTINKVRGSLLLVFISSSNSASRDRRPPSLLTAATANIGDHHVTPGSAITFVDHHARSHVTGPSTPLPSLEDVGVLTPPQRPTTSTMPMKSMAPCYQPPPPVECHVSEKEGTRRG